MKKNVLKILLTLVPLVIFLLVTQLQNKSDYFIIIKWLIHIFISPLYLSIVGYFFVKSHWKNELFNLFIMLCIALAGEVISFFAYCYKAFPPSLFNAIPKLQRDMYYVDDITIALYQLETMLACANTVLFWGIRKIIRCIKSKRGAKEGQGNI